MKPSGRAVLSLVVVVAASLTGLAVLGAYAPGDGLPRFTPGAPVDSPDAGASGPPGTRRPQGAGGAAGLPVSFVFHDLEEKEQQISCTVDEKSYRKAVESYGYPADRNAVWKDLNRRLESHVQKEVRRLGLREHLKLTVSSKPGRVWKGEVTGTWEIPKSLPESRKVEIRKKVQDFNKWLEVLEKDGKAEEIARDYYREKGFVRGRNGLLEIDYVNHARNGTGSLLDCFRSVKQAAGEEDKFRQLFFLTSLLQEMPFESGAQMIDQARIVKAEFRVPADVVVSNKGDCDSKSVTFASMWRNHPEPVLLVHEWNGRKGRYHTLVAVEPVPGAGPAHLPLGLRRFVLCEVAGTVAGTKKLHPGVRYESGRYVRYDCVPPAGMEESGSCALESPWEDLIRDFLRMMGLPVPEETPAAGSPGPAVTG